MAEFNIERDNMLIAKGSHFWCEACLVAVPLDDQSKDPRYCQGCFEVLTQEAEMQPSRRVAWMPKNISHKTAPEATQTTPARQEVVAKIKQPIIPPTTDKSALLKQRGRPRKEGEVSRATEWRRRKEAEQGVLL